MIKVKIIDRKGKLPPMVYGIRRKPGEILSVDEAVALILKNAGAAIKADPEKEKKSDG